MKRIIATLSVVLLVAGGPASAEPGDYSTLQILVNLVSPPPANNPVTPAQANDDYPLLVNPAGFDDGFDPSLYYTWQTVQLHPDTDAVCGNGSPYKFFVNRAPTTSNMVVFMEPGGACWDYESCTGGSLLGARNPNGVPDDYLALDNFSTGLSSPFIFRFHPYSRTKVQAWTMVYVPYCTGDVYTGDSIAEYTSADGTDTILWHHNGLRNVRAVIAWLKNNIERPVQMLSTGCSAGGTGSLSNYYHLRRDMAPDLGFMLNDSGPIVSAVANAGAGTPSPSYPLHTQIRDVWGLDAASPGEMAPLVYLAEILPGFDTDDMGSISTALASQYPNDRLGHTHFWQDYNYSRYSYEDFYPFINQAPSPAVGEFYTRLLWWLDTVSLVQQLAPLPNYGVYIPNNRDLNDSHCTTIVDFRHGDIQEAGLELEDFIDSLLDGTGPVLNAVELDWSADFAKPQDPLYELIDQLLL
ncbi:MAG: hypothetical protein H6983_13235 [Ectothiorhodospiraceae bacterium]|nr:hypothetical protein [Ectothiorhodospiraceae bacterium]